MNKYAKHIVIIVSFFLVYGIATGEEVNVIKLASEPVPFNEKREPVNDALYNAFDNDKDTAALFSDFLVQFNVPIIADEIKIINGNRWKFSEFSRLKDLEMVLYTTGGNGDSKDGKSFKKKDKEKKIKKERIKKDSDIKNTKDLTVYLSDEIPPVIGELNIPLAEEPVKPVLSETEKSQKNKSTIKKIDIRDSVNTSTGEKVLKKKSTAVKKVNKQEKNKKKIIPGSSIKKETLIQTENKTKRKPSNAEIKKETKSAEDDIPFKKMEGVIKIENDSEERVLINVSLKDISGEQSIKLGGLYKIKAIEFRKRDDFYYKGTVSELPYISGISFLNKGKRLTIQGLETLKRNYEDRFVRALDISISGKIFSAYDNDKEITRMIFRKNGEIEIRDRYKCFKKDDNNCTSAMMPDKWMIRNGRLYMRYAGEWISWKYELEYTPDIMGGAESESDSSQWLKLYYKNNNGFTDNYLYLEKSKNQEWGWN